MGEATPYFDGCLPIEVMAERGRETLRHGPMKPFGLTNPHKPQAKALRRRAAAPGQRARHAVQHGRLPDQAEARRAGAHLPHHSRPRQRRVRAARRPAPQHLPQFAEAARRDAAAQGASRGCASPARSPAARAMWNRPPSACSPAASPPPSGSASRSSLPPPTTAHGALLGHITGGHIETIDAGPRSFQPMNVNFGLFPPLGARPDARTPTASACAAPRRPSPRSARCAARALADLDGLDRAARSAGVPAE